MAVTFISGVTVARLLGPEFRGEWASIALFINILSTVSLLSLGDSYLYHKRKYYTEKNISYMIVFSFVIVIIIGTLLFHFAHHLIDDKFKNISYVWLISTILIGTVFSISRIDKDLLVFNKAKLLVATVNTILILFFAYAKNISVNMLIYIMLFSLFCQFIYVFKNSTLKQFKLDKEWTPVNVFSYVNYGLKLHLTVVLGILINNFDKIYLFFNARNVDFGIYAVAYAFSRLIGILPTTLSSVLYARFAGESEKEASKITSLVYSFLFIPLIVAACILSMLSYFLVPFIYGKEYQDAIAPICILLFECVISGLGWILAQRFNAAGKPGLVFIRQIIAITPLLFLLWIMPDSNITIILSLAMLLASIIRLCITLYMYKKILKEPVPRFYPNRSTLNMAYKKLRRVNE